MAGQWPWREAESYTHGTHRSPLPRKVLPGEGTLAGEGSLLVWQECPGKPPSTSRCLGLTTYACTPHGSGVGGRWTAKQVSLLLLLLGGAAVLLGPVTGCDLDGGGAQSGTSGGVDFLEAFLLADGALLLLLSQEHLAEMCPLSHLLLVSELQSHNVLRLHGAARWLDNLTGRSLCRLMVGGQWTLLKRIVTRRLASLRQGETFLRHAQMLGGVSGPSGGSGAGPGERIIHASRGAVGVGVSRMLGHWGEWRARAWARGPWGLGVRISRAWSGGAGGLGVGV